MTFELPDGSKGVLNSGSSIEYSIPFVNNRKIELTGEAYFDVEKIKNNPFSVFTSHLEVKVLGTKFNVNEHLDTKSTEVILQEGKVECLYKGQKIGTLSPHERIIIADGKVSKSKVNADKYIAWKDGKLVFRGDSMKEVARRLELWFDIDVEIADEELNSYSFRGTFENDKLEEVLRLLKLTSPFQYKIIKRKKLPNGSFSKKKVIFYL